MFYSVLVFYNLACIDVRWHVYVHPFRMLIFMVVVRFVFMLLLMFVFMLVVDLHLC